MYLVCASLPSPSRVSAPLVIVSVVGTGAVTASRIKVGVGDIIHLYFVDGDGGRPIGAFRVVAPFRHPNGALYTAAIPKTSLRRIADPEMREALKAAGYEPDPQLNELCGWPVVVDEEEHRSPSYLAALFPGRNTLVLR